MNGGGCFALLRCSTTIFPPFLFPLHYSTCCMCIVIDGAQKVVASISLNSDFFFFVFFFLLRFSCFFPVCLVHFFVCSPRAKPQGRGHRGTLTRQDISFSFLSRKEEEGREKNKKREKSNNLWPFFLLPSHFDIFFLKNSFSDKKNSQKIFQKRR